MTEADFLKCWRDEEKLYLAWGIFVQERIESQLHTAAEISDLTTFLKIQPKPRLKDDDSLLGKAFHREKLYEDPYRQIEDKVGLRFVVLLTTDIATLQIAIEKSDAWTWSLDKDFEADRDSRPMEFAYQSKHYVVKAARDTEFKNLVIPKDTPCEIQLRTLLQHAHSELTHDNIYKRNPSTEVSKKVERTIAKSMALIEAVDDFFTVAIDELQKATEAERHALSVLTDLYKRYIGKTPHIDKSNAIVLNAFRDLLTKDFEARINNLLQKKSFIVDRIKERSVDHYTYRQPWILLAYLVTDASPHVTRERWPLTIEEIEPVFTDLGKATHH